jgi:hypothetical protein
MATETELEGLFSRAVADKGFRNKLAASPDATAKSVGVTLTPDQIKAIENASSRMTASSTEISEGELAGVVGGAALPTVQKIAAGVLIVWT